VPYPKPQTWEFTLEPLGAPELKVVCRDPMGLPASQLLRLQRAAPIMMRLQRGIPPEPGEDWAIVAMDEAVRGTIVEWNLPYPDGHPRAGEVIPLDSDDPLGPLPGEVYRLILEQVGRRLMAPPKSAAG
jgi:hypothetical protein